MRFLLYFLIAFAPLPLASARPAWQWMWVAWVGVTALALLIKSFRRGLPPIPKAAIAPILLAALFTTWGFAQAFLPVGPGLLFGIEVVDERLQENGVISVSPFETIANANYFLAHLILFVGALLYCSRRDRITALIRFIGIIGGLYALYGFAVYVSGNAYVLWFDRPANATTGLSSSFINRNSYAAYAGLGLQCLIAYAYFWTQNELSAGRTGREKIRHVLEMMLTKAWWLPVSIFMTATALLLTHSRAGFISAISAVLLLILLSPHTFKGEKRRPILKTLGIVAAFLIVGGGLFTLSGEILETRLEALSLDTLRTGIYETMPAIIADVPWTGTGLGTFDFVFTHYITTPFGLFYIDRAHTDHLELIMTAGIPATLVLYAALAFIVVVLIRSLHFGLQYRSFIALGITAMLQLAIHSFVDFSLQMPAVSYLWVIILAASLATADRAKKAWQTSQ